MEVREYRAIGTRLSVMDPMKSRERDIILKRPNY